MMMDVDRGSYRKLAIRTYPARTERETSEGRYWRAYRKPEAHQHVAGVTHLQHMQDAPHHFVATSSTRVMLYHGRTGALMRQFGRFADVALSGELRRDGRTLAAGGADGIVKLFDASSRALIRRLEGHARAAHVARFAPDSAHLLSAGDDATGRWWDLPTGAEVRRLTGHTDYVRSAASRPGGGGEQWVTGGYDRTVRVWDIRGAGSACALKMDHGAPVEAVAFWPGGSILATAGGAAICVWDLVGGGRLLWRLANHQKTVTCLQVLDDGGPLPAAAVESDSAVPATAPRMLCGGLDGHVKVYELSGCTMTHAARYPSPILSLSVAPDASTWAVGAADGALAIRVRRKPRAGGAAIGTGGVVTGWRPRLTAGSRRYWARGTAATAAAGDYVAAARASARLAPYDRALRSFRYRDALDSALSGGHAAVAASVLEELGARGGLRSALAGRDAAALLPLLRLLWRYAGEPRHSKLLAAVAGVVLDLYGGALGAAPAVDAALRSLRERLAIEVAALRELASLAGTIEPLLAASGWATA